MVKLTVEERAMRILAGDCFGDKMQRSSACVQRIASEIYKAQQEERGACAELDVPNDAIFSYVRQKKEWTSIEIRDAWFAGIQEYRNCIQNRGKGEQ